MGFRSNFVLAKLGFDLREQFKDVIDQPFPEAIERTVKRLRGPGGEIARLEDHKPR